MTELVDRIAKLLAMGDVAAASHLADAAEAKDQALGRSVIALFKRDSATAIAQAERAFELGAGAPGLHYLALAKLSAGQADVAIDFARKAVALDMSPRSRASLGSVLLAANRPQDAVAVLRQVASEDPSSFDVQLNIGMASAQLSEFGEAVEAYARAFERRPADARPLQGLMMMFVEVGKWLGASAALELSRRGEPPPDVAVTLDLVMVHIMRQIGSGRFPARGIAEDPDVAVDKLITDAKTRSPAVQLVVARTLLDLGRLDDVKQVIDRLGKIDLDRTDRGSLAYLRGWTAERAGDRALALEHYEQALAADPERADACINALSIGLAEGTPAAFARSGKLLDAVAPHLRASVPELLLNEGVYLTRTGRVGEAPAKFRRVLEVSRPDSEVAKIANQALAELARIAKA